MKRRRKVKTLSLDVTPAPTKTAKLPGVDLGTLQSDFTSSLRSVKSTATKLVNAQEAFDLAKARHATISEKLKAASRAVLAEV